MSLLTLAQLQRLQDLADEFVVNRPIPMAPTTQGQALVELVRAVPALLLMARRDDPALAHSHQLGDFAAPAAGQQVHYLSPSEMPVPGVQITPCQVAACVYTYAPTLDPKLVLVVDHSQHPVDECSKCMACAQKAAQSPAGEWRDTSGSGHWARVRQAIPVNAYAIPRCSKCGCDLRYPTAAHVLDCGGE